MKTNCFIKINLNKSEFIFYYSYLLKNYFIQLLLTEIPYYLLYHDINEEDIVIDAGAFTGLFTLYAAKKVGDKGLVISYEPDPNNYKHLKKNCKINNFKNIKIIKKGLYSKKDILPFYSDYGGSTYIIDEQKNKNIIIKLPVSTLDYDMKKLGIKKIDFLKMDIEGSEIEAIKGAKNILKNSNAKIAIAAYHKVNNKITAPIVEKELRKLGYKTKVDTPHHLTVYAEKSNNF